MALRVIFFLGLAAAAAAYRIGRRTGSAAGARIAKRGQKAETKLIAGVPVLNYHTAYAGESLGEYGAEEEWVLVVKPGVTNAQIKQMCDGTPYGCNSVGSPSDGGVPFFEMRGTESDLAKVIESGKGAVKFVEVDGRVYATPELRADTENTLWNLERVGAYKRPNDGAGVSIFVLDTGLRHSHQDFGGRAIPGFDVTSGNLVECNGASNCAGDAQGHGTHCAGSAAGTTYGVAPGATIRSGKVLSDQGSGAWSWSYQALDWLATSSIRPAVASMSLGGSGTQQAMADAVNAASAAGVTVVVAGGNSNGDACNFSPAFVPAAITVGSTTSTLARSSFSNYGYCTDIWAPGSNILSADAGSDTGSRTLSGTSMACPHVSGGVALLQERNPSWNHEQVLEKLLADARINSITDLRLGDTNAELYVGSDAPPPPGSVAPITPAPTPAPPAPGTWRLSGDGCVMDGNCVKSNGHPSLYNNNEACTVELGAIPLAVDAFNTESNYDILTLEGRSYSGSSGPAAGTYSGTMSWTSDFSVVTTGWKICRTDV